MIFSAVCFSAGFHLMVMTIRRLFHISYIVRLVPSLESLLTQFKIPTHIAEGRQSP